MKIDNRLDFWVFIEAIFKWWRIIVFNVFTITLLAIVISLILPKKWTATTTILPPIPSTGSLDVENVGSAYTLSSMALSALPGIISPSDIIAGVMRSERIQKKLIDRFDIMKRYKLKKLDAAYKKIEQISEISITKEQMIKLDITTEDPNFSAEIANAYVEEIDKFNREVLMTTGKQYRVFLEKRLEEAEKELESAAESLKVFQEKYKVFSLEMETKKSVEIMGGLQGQIMAKKVQLNAVRSYSYQGNPHILQLQKEINALEKQLRELEYGNSNAKSSKKKDFGIGFSVPLSEVPDIGLQLTWLEMNLEIKKTIYSLLAEQYEKARIIESKDTPTITILDYARLPEERSFPRRKKIVVVAFVMSIFYGFGLSIVCESIERFKKENQNFLRIHVLFEKFKVEIGPILGKFKLKK